MRGHVLVRLGRDSNIHTTQSGMSILNLAGAYNIGWGDNKRTQWIDATVFGKKAEGLAQHCVKGKQLLLHVKDVELETFEKKDGTQGSKLKCVVEDVEFTADNQSQSSNSQAMPQFGSQQHAQQQIQVPAHVQADIVHHQYTKADMPPPMPVQQVQPQQEQDGVDIPFNPNLQ